MKTLILLFAFLLLGFTSQAQGVEVVNNEKEGLKVSLRGGISSSKLVVFGEEPNLNYSPYYPVINYSDYSFLHAYFAALSLRYPLGSKGKSFLMSEIGWNVKGLKLTDRKVSQIEGKITGQVHFLELNLEHALLIDKNVFFISGLGMGMGLQAISKSKIQNVKQRERTSVFKDPISASDMHLNLGLLYVHNNKIEFMLKLQQGFIAQDRIDEKYFNNPLFTNVKVGFGFVL